MRATVLLPLALLLAAAALAPKVTAEDAELEAAKGGVGFRLACASCHGQDAKGNGPVAEYLKIPPSDLTQLAARNDGTFPTDRVRASIDGREPARGHGQRDMPVWGEVFASDRGEEAAAAKLDELVAFIASIQEK